MVVALLKSCFIRWESTYSGQAEGHALFWLRLGFRHFGFIIPPKFWNRKSIHKAKYPKLARFIHGCFPLLRLDANAHTGRLDQKWLFRFYLFGFSVGWLTKGETEEYNYTYENAPRGLIFRHGLFGF